MKTSARAGRYVSQPTGYRAFAPAPLPPSDPPIDISRLLVSLSKADRAIGRLDSIMGFVPDKQVFVAFYVKKDAVLSSQIEGLHTTFIDVLEAEAGSEPAVDPAHLQETRNYLDALWHGLNRLESLPLSLRLIREMHEKLLHNVRGSEREPGEFRRSQNWIGAQGATIESAAFVPPAVSDMHAALDNLEKYFYMDDMPPLIRIALIHAQFETIHPFLDGNGRIGRMLITFLLVHSSILSEPILYTSLIFRLNRDEYYRRLQAIRDQGEWEEWIEFFLMAVTIAAKDAYQRTQEIVELQKESLNRIHTSSSRAAANLARILDRLMLVPIVRPNQIEQMLGVSASTSIRYLNELTKLGITREVTGRQRNREYRFQRFIDILDREIVT